MVVTLTAVSVAAAVPTCSLKRWSTCAVAPGSTVPAPICVPLSASATVLLAIVSTLAVEELALAQPPAPSVRTRK